MSVGITNILFCSIILRDLEVLELGKFSGHQDGSPSLTAQYMIAKILRAYALYYTSIVP